jgi:hypothetical protein
MLTLLRSRPGLLSLYRTLEAQAAAHKATLVSRVHSQLTHLLTNAVGGAAVAGAETGKPQTVHHCPVACALPFINSALHT